MRTAEMLVEQHVSSGPDVSHERRCHQTSPQQLLATKDPPKSKKSEFPSREAREFLGAGTKIQTLQKRIKINTSGVAFRRTKIPRLKSDNNSNFGSAPPEVVFHLNDGIRRGRSKLHVMCRLNACKERYLPETTLKASLNKR